MNGRHNPYRPPGSSSTIAKSSRRSFMVFVALACLTSSVIYGIGAAAAIWFQDGAASPETVGFSLAPHVFAIAFFCVAEVSLRATRISLGIYCATLLFFIVLYALVQEVYPVFIGVRKELLLPTIAGSISAIAWLLASGRIKGRIKGVRPL